jgi:N-acetylmuramic acid 6-phosphate etherase
MKLNEYAALSTERRHPRSGRLDMLSTLEIVGLMNREDHQVVAAVSRALKSIARVVSAAADGLQSGGRLFFVGAGTSGRLGVMEAAECPPTFNTPPGMIQAMMAGGRRAVFRSREGAEDSRMEAVAACRRARLGKHDVVVGIAASGVTPYVRAALAAARKRGARAFLLTCNVHSIIAETDGVIALDTGPEILTGSTRLKAGTACKMVLNMLTTATMVRLGKVYENWMVDLQPKSRKLMARGIRLVRLLGHVDPERAQKLFRQARGHVKPAIIMARQGLSLPEARRRLQDAGGRLRNALARKD